MSVSIETTWALGSAGLRPEYAARMTLRIYSMTTVLPQPLPVSEKSRGTWCRGRNGWQGQKYCRLTMHVTAGFFPPQDQTSTSRLITMPCRLLAHMP